MCKETHAASPRMQLCNYLGPYHALKSSQRDEPVKKLTFNIKNWTLRDQAPRKCAASPQEENNHARARDLIRATLQLC